MAQQAPGRSPQGLLHRCQRLFGRVAVEDDLSDAALNALLARLQWQYCVLEEEMEGAPCVCAERPEIPEVQVVQNVPGPRVPPALMTLPEELRSLIWREALAPRNGILRIVPYNIVDPRNETERRVGGPGYHPLRFEVLGAAQPDPERETWVRLGEAFNERDNQYNLLRVNQQVYREADNEIWRYAAAQALMFSFGPETAEVHQPGPNGTSEYDGILSAWTFFRTLLRDDPAVNPNLGESYRYLQYMRGVDYLPLIRRVHLDLTDTPLGANSQALAPIRRVNATNAIQYLDNLLDLMNQRLTGLEHLSLGFGGWVPDIRQTPWREGPPMPLVGRVPPAAHPSSAHWVNRLLNFRRVTRLRLRVVFFLPGADTILEPNLAQNPAVLRTAHFITELRRHMLVNGEALGGGFWNVYRIRDGNVQYAQPRMIVQCDDSWDADTGTHEHHTGGFEHDPP